MINSDDWQMLRTVTLALMAAVLEAGDRAAPEPPDGGERLDAPKTYAKDALALFNEAEKL